MVARIQDLCLKAAKHRQALQQMAAGDKQLSTAAAGEAPIIKKSAAGDSAMVAETAALLTKEIENMNSKQLTTAAEHLNNKQLTAAAEHLNNKQQLKEDLTLKIELEPTLPSVKDMEDRDRLDTET